MKQCREAIERTYARTITTGIMLVALLAVWLPVSGVAAQDETPPYLSALIPARGSDGNPPKTVVRAVISDDDRGVQANSINVEIDETQVQPIIEPSGRGFQITYSTEEPYPVGEEISVDIVAYDLESNRMHENWRFTVRGTDEEDALNPVYPFEGYWMSYSYDDARVSWSWSASEASDLYRLRLETMDPFAQYTLDLAPADYNSAFGVITFAAELTLAQWDDVGRIGEMRWTVSDLDAIGGSPLRPFFEEQGFRLALARAPVLSSPADYAQLRSFHPPVFRWRIDHDAMGYLFAMAQVDQQGDFTGLTHTAELPFFINELPISHSSWQEVADGDWLWTVLSVQAGGGYSEYMLRHFRKGDL